jgi:uncharacterized protein (TIGR03437 family)
MLLHASAPDAGAQTLQWVRQVQCTSAMQGKAISADATGIYALAYPLLNDSGPACLRKYQADGSVAWSRQIGPDAGLTIGLGVAATSNGVVVVGSLTLALPGQANAGASDAFVLKLDANGNQQWVRQFGTSLNDRAVGVALDGDNIYVVGDLNVGFFDQSVPSGYIRKYDAAGTLLWNRDYSPVILFSRGITADSTGAYVYGDNLIRKFDPNGNPLWTNTFYANALVAAAGALYATGSGPTTGLGITKLDLNGNPLWNRAYGSSNAASGLALTADASGVTVAGDTIGAFGGQQNAGLADGFVRKLDPNGNELWTAQFGTVGDDFSFGVAASSGSTYVVGTTSKILPTQSQTASISNGAFIARFASTPRQAPEVFDGGIVNAASFAPHPAPVAPGSIAVIFGRYLSGGTFRGPTATAGVGTQVRVNGTNAPVLFATPDAVGIQVPVEVTGLTSANLQLSDSGLNSPPRTFFIGSPSPGIFTASADGRGVAAALHEVESGSGVHILAPLTAPALIGEQIVIFGTGLGEVSPPVGTGVIPGVSRTVLPVSVTVGGLPAEVVYAGTAPGWIGLNQVNFIVPPAITSALEPGTLAEFGLTLSVGGRESNTAALRIRRRDE